MEKIMELPKKALATVFAVAVVCALAVSAGIAGAATSPSADSPSADSPSSATPGVVIVNDNAGAAAGSGATSVSAADYVTSPATGVAL